MSTYNTQNDKEAVDIVVDDNSVSSVVNVLEEVEGRRAWIVVLGSFLMHLIALGFLYSFGIFVTSYQEEFQVERAPVALAYTIGLACFFTLGIFSGRLSDMYGIKVIFITGSVLWVLGILLASFATQLIHTILTHGFLSSCGVALVYWPAVSIVPQWFLKRRALALGLSVLGAGLGNLIFSFFGEQLIASVGWRKTLRIVAGIGAVLLFIATFCLKRRLPTDKKGGILGDISVFRDPNFKKFWIGAFFFQFGYMVPFVHLVPYVTDLDLSPTFAALSIGLVGAGSAVGRVALGFVGDRVGHLRVFRWSVVLSGIVQLLWPLCKTEAPIALYAIFYGFFVGGFIAMAPVVMAAYFGTQRLGGIMGYVNLGMIPGALSGAPLAGLVKDMTGEYLGAIIAAGVLMLLAGFIMFQTDELPTQEVDKSEVEE